MEKMQCHRREWTEMGEGKEFEIPLTVSDQQLRSFAEVSGDLNPVHLDESFARAAGFRGRVVYGALIVAGISRMLGMEVPGEGCVWHSLSVQFKSALFVNEEARIKAKVTYANPDLGVLRMDVSVMRGDERIAEAKVQAGIKRRPE